MRKLFMSLLVLGGLALAGAAPASANAVGGLAVKPNVESVAPSQVDQVRWRGRHRGYRRHRGFSFGIGVPGFYGFYGRPHYGYRRGWRHRGYGHRGYYRRHRGWY